MGPEGLVWIRGSMQRAGTYEAAEHIANSKQALKHEILHGWWFGFVWLVVLNGG